MIALGKVCEFEEEKLYPILHNERKLLLIHHKNNYYLIENKCGHFELPLDKGSIENGAIRCPTHGITFDLITGEVENRPYEQCIPITILQWKIEENIFYFMDEL